MTARREGTPRRPSIAPAVASLLCLLALQPAPADAQARAVRLETPRCPTLPFAPARLRALLALELSVHGVTLREGSDADVAIGYEPVPCAPGATRYRLEVRDVDGAVRADEADMAEVPLGTVPRALALEIVETVRALDAARVGAASVGATSVGAASVGAASVGAASVDAASVDASGVGGSDGPPMDEASGSSSPRPTSAADQAVAGPADRDPPSAPVGAPIRFVLFGHLRNSPDTGAVLAGPRLGLDLPLGDGLPLSLRLDAALAFGPSAADVVVGAIDGGVTLSFWARAADVLALRFGPRLWLGHAFAVAGGEGATRRSEDVQVGLGVRVAAEIALLDGLDLLVEAEVGTNLHGLDLEVAGERSGFLGAYWGVDLGLGFH